MDGGVLCVKFVLLFLIKGHMEDSDIIKHVIK